MDLDPITARLDEIEAELSADSATTAVEEAEAAVEAARKAVEAAGEDHEELTAVQLVTLREKAARALAVAEVELSRAKASKAKRGDRLAAELERLAKPFAHEILMFAEKVKQSTKAKLEAVLGDSPEIWGGRTGGELQNAIATHAAPLRHSAFVLDARGYTINPPPQRITEIRGAVEAVRSFL